MSLVSLVSRCSVFGCGAVEGGEGGERSVGEGNERDIMVVRKEERGVGVRRGRGAVRVRVLQSRFPSPSSGG